MNETEFVELFTASKPVIFAATEAIKPTRAVYPRSEVLLAELQASITQAVQYSKDYLEDLPEVANWRWQP